MSHGVIRTDNMKCTKNGNIRSAKYYSDASTKADIDNGNLVEVSELLDGAKDREIFKAIKPTAASSKNVGVVATPEIIYDEQLKSTGALVNYYNLAGQAITVLMLAPGDVFSVSDDCFEGTAPTNANVNAKVTFGSSNPSLWLVNDGDGNTMVGQIIARELHRAGEYLNVIQILKAN